MDQDCRNAIYSEDYFDFIVGYGKNIGIFEVIPNSCSYLINISDAALYAPIANLPTNIIQLFGYRSIPRCFGLADMASIEASGANRVRNIPALNLRGEGVLIGIIDTGIEYTHNSFRKADGTSRILSIWDQSIQSQTGMPEGFEYGTEYTREQINAALNNPSPLSIVPSTDENGHGTYLAGIIAGSPNAENNFSGVVPDAELVVVKLKPAKSNLKEFFQISPEITCYQENDILIALKYLNDLAVKLNRPISICIGLCSSQGSHDPSGALDRYVGRIADFPGTSISVAAGNEGQSGLHFQGVVTNRADEDVVELRVGPNEYGFSMELWGTVPNTYSLDILSPSGEYIPRIPARIRETRKVRFIFEETVISVDYIIVEPYTGDELIVLRFSKPAEGIWRFRIYGSGDVEKRYHIWMPLRQFLKSEQTSFTEPDPENTTTSPSYSAIALVPTAYDISNKSLYLNASRGYLRNDEIVPHFAAPGVNMIGPGLNNSYITSSGTSVAAAHTTGIAAMLLEWAIVRGNDILLGSRGIKNLLIRGADRDPNITYPSKEWGYGIINIYNTFINIRGDII